MKNVSRLLKKIALGRKASNGKTKALVIPGYRIAGHDLYLIMSPARVAVKGISTRAASEGGSYQMFHGVLCVQRCTRMVLNHVPR